MVEQIIPMSTRYSLIIAHRLYAVLVCLTMYSIMFALVPNVFFEMYLLVSVTIHGEIPQVFERTAVDVQGCYSVSGEGNRLVANFLDMLTPQVICEIIAALLIISISYVELSVLLVRHPAFEV